MQFFPQSAESCKESTEGKFCSLTQKEKKNKTRMGIYFGMLNFNHPRAFGIILTLCEEEEQFSKSSPKQMQMTQT